MAGTVHTDSDDECRACPVRRTKPTAILLQHSERAALPSQTKAINAFCAAEAAKHAAKTQQVASDSTVLLGSSSDTLEQGKRVHVEEIFDEDRSQYCANRLRQLIRIESTMMPNPEKTMTTRRYGRMHTLIQSRHVEAQSDDIDTDGIPIDIDVQSIVDVSPTCEGKTADIDHFFGLVFKKTGTNGKGCVLVNEPTTLRRHAEANFAGKYRTWAKTTQFESMLPGDIKDHKEKALAERVVPYSDKLFKTVAIEWLIATDQLIQALEHPKFKDMIDVAARATNGIKIPGRKATCAEIMCIFKNRLTKLKVTLNSDKVHGAINITCDVWQASNADGYFAVTGHWIQKDSPLTWDC
ncbi:hypothetical protein EV424DRAFT_1537953 [Suillus variegatus]|nr:hypothetical protein EV424DRAFT_1537953 [Suillus variegatus]